MWTPSELKAIRGLGVAQWEKGRRCATQLGGNGIFICYWSGHAWVWFDEDQAAPQTVPASDLIDREPGLQSQEALEAKWRSEGV